MDLKYAFADDAVALSYYLASLDKRCFPADGMNEEEWKQALSNKWCCVVYAPEWFAAGVMTAAAGIAYLYSVAVTFEMRHKGIGELLIKERLDIARAICCTKAQAHTRTGNEGIQRLLKKCGFLATDYVPDFYDDFEDGIKWEMIL